MTQAAALRLLLLLMVFWVEMGRTQSNQFVCYDCFANSTNSGQFCSIDRLCTGASCYFAIYSDGSWNSGCSQQTFDSSQIQCKQMTNEPTICGCTGDFCNKIQDVNYTLHTSITDFVPIPYWPQGEMITCQECGNLTINGLVKDIACDENHLCQGQYCVTKRGQTPHSYCGSIWEGIPNTACFKNPGEDEHCVCPQQMCNAVLPTEQTVQTTTISTTTPSLTTILTTTTTVPTPAVDPEQTTTKKLVRRCRSEIKFSPNAQAVLMGEKLKDVILGGFGTDGKALQEFQDGINTHICAYEPE